MCPRRNPVAGSVFSRSSLRQGQGPQPRKAPEWNRKRGLPRIPVLLSARDSPYNAARSRKKDSSAVKLAPERSIILHFLYCLHYELPLLLTEHPDNHTRDGPFCPASVAHQPFIGKRILPPGVSSRGTGKSARFPRYSDFPRLPRPSFREESGYGAGRGEPRRWPQGSARSRGREAVRGKAWRFRT